MFDFSRETIIGFLYALPGILFALSIHEFSHAYVANKLGDPTAKLMGRLTMNPIKHIDPLGIIAMFLVRFGWAKPVQVNSRYLKKPRRDMAFIAIAGPVSNLISAIVGFILFWLAVLFIHRATFLSLEIKEGIIYILENFVYLNIALAIFNLIPIPPLDGSRILDSFLPPKALLLYHKYEDIIRIVLLVLLICEIITIAPIVDWIFLKMLDVATSITLLFL
ncbi:MAG: site-2 protease family protein [Ruminococcaceae bacterium]|nr:site-2 protease family protein [Oscillospiraceae bacterium]